MSALGAPCGTEMSVQGSPHPMCFVDHVAYVTFDATMQAWMVATVPRFPANGRIREFFWRGAGAWYWRYGRYPDFWPGIEIYYTWASELFPAPGVTMPGRRWAISLNYPLVAMSEDTSSGFYLAAYANDAESTEVRGTYTKYWGSAAPTGGTAPPASLSLDGLATALGH